MTLLFIVNFFNSGVMHKNTNHVQEQFLEDLVLYILKMILSIKLHLKHLVEKIVLSSTWLGCVY
jgi:hypothetical protein